MIGSRAGRTFIVLGITLAFAASPCFGGEYRLGVSDRLKIKVQEWPDLTGEYAVTSDGSISLPLVGGIDAAGHSIKELAREISDRLQQRTGGTERPFAAVEIVQFRPYSIVGDVQKPGEYPFRPGLTVLQAIGAAGGYYRPDLGSQILRLDRDIAVAKGDIRTASLKRTRLIARAARLKAAIEGQDNVVMPPELLDQKDDPSVSAIMEGEQAALAQENETARSEQTAFENVRSLYQRQMASLRGQIDSLKQEKGTIQHQLDELRALSARGLALSATLLTLERTAAQIVNQQMVAETEIVKAEESVTLAEQRVHERAEERGRLNIRELQQTKDEMAEVQARLRTADDLLKEAQFLAPAEARERLLGNGQRPSFTLVRKDGETTREIAGDESTLVEPNDVIKIPTVQRPASPAGYTNLSRLGHSQQAER
jgi:protein involved in polysaccharide export with SLBB domain